jgi:hypothetical protein
MNQINFYLFVFLFSFGVAGEIQYQPIFLSGLITNPKQEISGMDLYKDQIMLLPENLGGFLYMISKGEILNALEKKEEILIEPKQPAFHTPDYSKFIPGFEGLEAIAFNGNNVYITLESKDDKMMRGYLAWGTIDPTTKEVTIPKKNLLELETPIQVNNMTFESLLIHNDHIILFYETQGINLQKSVWQYRVSLADFSVSKIEFPNIEYRITDVSRVDDQNHFWAINYYWPGDAKHLKPAPDPIVMKIKEGKSHQNSDVVERLIEFEFKEDKIQLSGREPIQIELDEKASRNWEGIVRLDDRGFLVATDKYPEMILGFIPFK